MRVRAAAFLACVVALPVSAQDSAQVEKALSDCRTITKDADRLDCYDSKLDALYGVDEELAEVRAEAKVDRFGFRNNDGGLENSQIQAAVVQVSEDITYKTTVVSLDNGQVWQLLDRGILRARFNAGDVVTIAQTSLGGFRLRMEGRQGYRSVKRLR